MDRLATDLIEATFTLTRCIRTNMSFSHDLAHLSILQMYALVFIKKNDGVQMTEIATQFKIELPSATSLINKLTKMKLVTRKADEKDRRIVRLYVTNEGRTLLEQAMKEKVQNLSKILSLIPEADREQLLVIIKKINTKFIETYEK